MLKKQYNLNINMKHLRLFETENEHTSEVDNLDLPCITYVEETSEIEIYPKVNCCIATYNISNTLNSSQILGNGFNSSQIQTMLIDGVEVEPTSQYKFATTGEHTVKIILNKNFTNAHGMFANCTGLTSLNLSNFDTSNVTDMASMFNNCTSLTSLKMMGDINKLRSTGSMFSNITTTGTFYYNSAYDYSKIIAELPTTWTAVAV